MMSVYGRGKADQLRSVANRETRVRGGLAGGRNAVVSGQLAGIRTLGNHVRWHVNRNTVKADCAFCFDA